jgi:hypothetical protein
MENELRNDLMDEYFEAYDFRGVHAQDAIHACDQKARAWDQLKQLAIKWEKQTPPIYIPNLVKVMSDLLTPPKPKSKLERLRDFVRVRGSSWPTFPPMIRESDILDMIHKLEAEDDRGATG